MGRKKQDINMKIYARRVQTYETASIEHPVECWTIRRKKKIAARRKDQAFFAHESMMIRHEALSDDWDGNPDTLTPDLRNDMRRKLRILGTDYGVLVIRNHRVIDVEKRNTVATFLWCGLLGSDVDFKEKTGDQGPFEIDLMS